MTVIREIVIRTMHQKIIIYEAKNLIIISNTVCGGRKLKICAFHLGLQTIQVDMQKYCN